MEHKGKQSLPYLLSTTKTLIRCKQYYYTDFDYRFNCKRNRDCYTEHNVRANVTRMWHNVIIPNAILCRQYGHPATFREAIDALNYAMSHGKTDRSLKAWNAVCEAERKIAGQPESIVHKFRSSFYFYALGMAVNKDGLVYNLPKSKVMDLDTYRRLPSVRKYIWNRLEIWYCPWRDLNMLVDAWRHHQDKYCERIKTLNDTIEELEDRMRGSLEDRLCGWKSVDAEEKSRLAARRDEAQKLLDDLVEPEFPMTQRAIVDAYHVSMTSAARFLHWYKQMVKKTGYQTWSDTPSKVYWPGKKPKKFKQAEPEVDDTPVDDVDIDKAIQAVVNSGDRPVGRVDDDSELPF